MAPLLTRPEVILTHESDLDGFVSGLLLQRLARHLFDDDVELEAYHYQGWKMRALRETVAWVADFTLEPRMDRANWLILDHHTTAIHPKLAYWVHDPQKSASLLCYELVVSHGLGSPQLDRIVHLTNLGDLFLEDHPEFELACDYASLVKTYGFWNLHQILNGDLEAILDHPLLQVMSTKRRVEDPIGYSLAVANQIEISPEIGTVRPPIGNTNLIVHRMLNTGDTKYAVLVSIYRKGMGSFVVSFRSRHGEALAVAQKFEGGGGHPNAAGAMLPRGVNTYDDAVEYLRLRLNLAQNSSSVLQVPVDPVLNEPFAGLKWPG